MKVGRHSHTEVFSDDQRSDNEVNSFARGLSPWKTSMCMERLVIVWFGKTCLAYFPKQ